MIIACRDYLVKKLSQAGVGQAPLTSAKRLELWQSPRVSAVLFDGETFERAASAKRYTGDDSARHKRRKLFSREAAFSVVIGDHEPERTAELLEAFVAVLDRGFYLNGNYVAVEPGEAEWVDRDDSILKSRVGVNLRVKFTGGVYRDSDLVRVNEVEVVGVSREEQ